MKEAALHICGGLKERKKKEKRKKKGPKIASIHSPPQRKNAEVQRELYHFLRKNRCSLVSFT